MVQACDVQNADYAPISTGVMAPISEPL